jgi:hypothetical protein
MEEFEKLLKLALADGVITDKERELLMKKAKAVGIDEIEAEMIIEGKLSETKAELDAAEETTDGFQISNEELLLRTTKWVSRISEKKIKVDVERFPRINQDTPGFQKYLDAGSDVMGKLNVVGVVGNVAGMIPGVGGIVKGVINMTGVGGPQKLDNKEIRDITDKYLIILELRAKTDEHLMSKYKSLQENYKHQVSLFEEKNKKGFGKFF